LKNIYFNDLKYGLSLIAIFILVISIPTSIINFPQFHDILGKTTSDKTTSDKTTSDKTTSDKTTSVSTSDLNAKGKALADSGDNNGAIASFDKVLAIDPNNISALSNKGKALSNLGDNN
jgi:Flp pilus assembly protein TadD